MATSTKASENADMASSRRKSTAACEMCRKRKARCSGATPCGFCIKHKFVCVFDLDRQKRGRRPKALMAEQIEPYFAAMSFDTSVPFDTRDTPSDIAMSLPVGAPLGADPNGVLPSDHSSYRPFRHPWQENLYNVVTTDNFKFASNVEIPVTVVAHLIDIFFEYINDQQCRIIEPNRFFERLLNQTCSTCLLGAVLAVSIRYSRNSMFNPKLDNSLDDTFCNQAREEMQRSIEKKEYLDRAQALCIIALFQSRCENWAQAWCDLSTARGLLQIILIDRSISSKDLEAAKVTQAYLLVTERTHALGHPNFITSLNLSLSDASQWWGEDDIIANSSLFVGLLEVLLKTQAFFSGLDAQCSHSSWMTNPDFINILKVIDQYHMTHHSEICFDPRQMVLEDNSKAGFNHQIFLALAWHCCTVVANSVFLPIPERANVDLDIIGKVRCVTSLQISPTVSAPRPFIVERMYACETSARSIAIICAEIMANGKFTMAPFLGYCCFQSSIVLINQLRCSRTIDSSSVIENLKTNLTLLGTMQKFFEPVRIWISVLLELHDPHVKYRFYKLSENSTLPTYFARYAKMVEPPYIALEKRSENTMQGVQQDPELSPADDLPPPAEKADECPERDNWVQEYQIYLQENLCQLNLGVRFAGFDNESSLDASRDTTRAATHNVGITGSDTETNTPNATQLANYRPDLSPNFADSDVGQFPAMLNQDLNSNSNGAVTECSVETPFTWLAQRDDDFSFVADFSAYSPPL